MPSHLELYRFPHLPITLFNLRPASFSHLAEAQRKLACSRQIGPFMAGIFQLRSIDRETASSEEEVEVLAALSFGSEAQIGFVMKQAEVGTAVGEVYRKAGISEAKFYNWHTRYARLMPSVVKRLRPLEEENAKPK